MPCLSWNLDNPQGIIFVESVGKFMRTLKRFGQHWLTDPNILDRIAAAAPLQDQPIVLEIGPGTGNLTFRLLRSAPVVAVEIDRRLAENLRKQFAGHSRFTLIEGDILQIPLPTEPTVAVANIPYNISGPILKCLLGTLAQPHQQFSSIVLLVQKELAERICAPPGSRTYGALSIRIQYLAECELLFSVPARCFQPPPQVESTVIRLTPRPYSNPPKDIAFLEKLVERAFATRRKMMRNCLKGWLNEETLAEAMASINLHPDLRAENLSLAHFIALANLLSGEKA